MASLVHTFPGANNLDHIRVVVKTRDRHLGGSVQLDGFQLGSFTSNDEPVMLLGDFKFDMSLNKLKMEELLWGNS